MQPSLLAAFCAGMSLAPALAGADHPAIQRVEPLVHGGPFGGRILSLAAGPTDPNVLYAGTESGLFRSADGGASWSILPLARDILLTPLGQFGRGVDSIFVSPEEPSVILASVAETAIVDQFPYSSQLWLLYRSDDSGASWAQVLLADRPLSLALGLSRWYANAGSASENQSFMAVSTDHGAHWAFTTAPEVEVVAVDPVENTRVYAIDAAGTVERSVDGGATWRTTPLANAGVHILRLDGRFRMTVYAAGDGFYRSDDGASDWTPNRWTSSTPIVAFAESPSGLSAATSSGDVYTSIDRGDTWTRAGAIPGGLVALAADGGGLLAGGDGTGVFRSDDGGASWSARSAGLDAAAIGAVAVAASDPSTVYAIGGPGFARSTDAGRTWSIDPAAPTAKDGALAVASSDPRVVYASAATSGVVRSGDGGVSWTPTFPTGLSVASIAVSPSNPATSYMADGRLWRTDDSGEHWNHVDAMAGEVDLVAFDPTAPDSVYAANGSLYRSDDSGSTWEQVGTLGGNYTALTFDPKLPGTLYAIVSATLWKSADRGGTWSFLGVPAGKFAGTFVSALAIDRDGAVTVGIGSAFPHIPGPFNTELLRSIDGGASWFTLSDWGPSAGPVGTITSLAADDPSFVYVATSASGVWRMGRPAPRLSSPR